MSPRRLQGDRRPGSDLSGRVVIRKFGKFEMPHLVFVVAGSYVFEIVGQLLPIVSRSVSVAFGVTTVYRCVTPKWSVMTVLAVGAQERFQIRVPIPLGCDLVPFSRVGVTAVSGCQDRLSVSDPGIEGGLTTIKFLLAIVGVPIPDTFAHPQMMAWHG